MTESFATVHRVPVLLYSDKRSGQSTGRYSRTLLNTSRKEEMFQTNDLKKVERRLMSTIRLQ